MTAHPIAGGRDCCRSCVRSGRVTPEAQRAHHEPAQWADRWGSLALLAVIAMVGVPIAIGAWAVLT
jgi:hypothetical protein